MKERNVLAVLGALDAAEVKNKTYESAVQMFKEAADDFASTIQRFIDITNGTELEMDPDNLKMLDSMRDVRDTARRGQVSFEERAAFSPREAAAMLGVAPSTLYRWLNEGLMRSL